MRSSGTSQTSEWKSQGRVEGITILIATHGRPDSLSRTLCSMQDATPCSLFREIVVVENGEELGAREICVASRGWLPVRYVFEGERRKSTALNRGVDEARGAAIVFFDDDVRIAPRCILAYADAIERYGPGHMFGGPVVPEFERVPEEWMRPWLPPSVLGWDQGPAERYYDRPYFIGSNWSAWRDEIQDVGGFARHLGPGNPSGALGDETELQSRLLRSGVRGVYLPEAAVHHRVLKEAASLTWMRERRRRLGVTRALMDARESALPGWREGLARRSRVVALGVKVAIARALGWTDERRAWLECTLAEERGYLSGTAHARVLPEDRAG